MEDFIPENNIVILFLLIILTGGLYYFWWLVRTSRVFGDDPSVNIILTVLTCGLWSIYLCLHYIHKSEALNGRDAMWYTVFFLPISPLIIQNNLNEKYFPDKYR